MQVWEEVGLRKTISDAKEEYIDAYMLLVQYNFPRCWKTVEQARPEFASLGNPTRRMRAVKE